MEIGGKVLLVFDCFVLLFVVVMLVIIGVSGFLVVRMLGGVLEFGVGVVELLLLVWLMMFRFVDFSGVVILIVCFVLIDGGFRFNIDVVLWVKVLFDGCYVGIMLLLGVRVVVGVYCMLIIYFDGVNVGVWFMLSGGRIIVVGGGC